MSNLQSVQMSTNVEETPMSTESDFSNGISIRENVGVLSTNPDGSVSQKGYNSTSATEAPVFLNRFGNPSSTFCADGSVQIGGMTVSGKVAERMGYISKDPAGNNQINQSAVANDSVPDMPAVQQTSSFAMDDRSIGEVNSLLDGVSDPEVAAISASAIGGLVAGDVSQAADRYAKSTGLDPEAAAVKFNQAVQVYSNKASEYLSTQVNLSADDHADLINWSKQNSPAQLREAYEAIAYRNDFSKLGKLVDGYTKSVEPTTAALENAGIQHRQGIDGKTTIFLRGQWISLASAVRAGLI